MNLPYEMVEEFAQACAEAEILWRKRRQHARGEIDMGKVYDFEEDYCTDRMRHYRSLWVTLNEELDSQ